MTDRVESARSLNPRRTLPFLALVLATSIEAIAADGPAADFDFPAQPLASTLDALAKQTNTKLIYSDSMVEGMRAQPLKGRFSIQEALRQLLADNGLQHESMGDGVIAVKKAALPKVESKSNDSVFELGTMTVTAQNEAGKLTSRDIATSVDIMNADKIEDQNVVTSFDLLHRMPGVQITQFNQGTTTGKFSFRAFNGEGNINAVKLLIDGIPSNSNDGNMPFIDALFPLDIESIEVVRGTNDPRYGLYAIAGNTNINTYTGGNYVKGRVSYGSFDTNEIQSGLGYEKNGITQNYAVSHIGTNGYRDHASLDKNSFSGKWSFTPEDSKYTVGLSTRWGEAEAEESGYLTYQQARENPRQSPAHNATDGGERQTGQVSSFLDVNLTDRLFWSTKGYANTYEDKRFVRFNAKVSQQERLLDEVQYGGITSLTYRPVVSWLDDFSVETGFDFQQQENKTGRYNTLNRIRTRHTREQEFDFLIYGGYLQAVIKPTEWLKITPGFRADRIEGDFANLLNNTKAEVNDYGTIWQPKVGAVITPIDGYSLYGNWGRTFQVGVGAATYKTNPGAIDIEPSINAGWEVGLKLQPVEWAEGRLAYWQQDATNESSRVLNSVNNDSVLIGATKRQGVDVQVKVNPIEDVSLWAAYSIQEAIVKTAPSNTAYKVGNQIINTPDYVFSAGIDYQITPTIKSSLWTTGQGDYYTDQSNSKGQFGEYALLNLDLGYQVTKEVDLQFQIKNLTDTYWEYVWYDDTSTVQETMHSPGDGRAFYGAINVKFDY